MFTPNQWFYRRAVARLRPVTRIGRLKLAADPSSSRWRLEALAHDLSPEVRAAVAVRPNLPAKLMELLANDFTSEVQAAVCCQPLPPHLIRIVSENESSAVRQALPSCPTLSYASRLLLVADAASSRNFIANEAADLLFVATDRNDTWLVDTCASSVPLARLVLQHPWCTAELATKLAGLDDSLIASAVVSYFGEYPEVVAEVVKTQAELIFTNPLGSRARLLRHAVIKAPALSDAVLQQLPAMLVLECAPSRVSISPDADVTAATTALAADNPRSLAEVRESAELLLTHG